jgi:hypothetical protein
MLAGPLPPPAARAFSTALRGIHRFCGSGVDKSVGPGRSRTRFRALGASRLVWRQSLLNRDSVAYWSVASCSSIHWSPRGVHVTRSRVA